jgi:hypothetical protein
MRRYFGAIFLFILFLSGVIFAADPPAKKKTAKSSVSVEEQLAQFQAQLKQQQSQMEQQQLQIQQLQQQLQQSNAQIQQQDAQLQAGVRQAAQQALTAQQSATDLTASVAEMKATSAEALKSSAGDHKILDKLVNPDVYQAPLTFIPAAAPLRMLPLDPPKKDGLVPAIRIGVVRVTPYGFIKATVVHDSSSPRGDDFPIPGFLSADTGPDAAPEFHIKARATRFGTNFEWPDVSKNLTITGKVEWDFEGPFSRVDNRNISAIRSSAPSIRLAFVRMDYKHSETDWFFEAGQDWTPFGSSTLPNIFETTGVAMGFGGLWERQPMMRMGFVQSFGGKYDFKVSPEIALVLPGFGNLPTDVGQQLGYGERQGADSDRPEIEGRLVFQWKLDDAKGVAPAQIIFSGVQGERKAIVLASAIPTDFLAAFPNGASVTSDRWGGSVEAQLPTRWFTLSGKAYRGADLRYFFAGQLFSNYNDTAGLTDLTKVASVDGGSTLVFGLNGSTPVVAPQRPARANGGFLGLGLPLSRWFNANPAGRNAGWQLNLTYGLDQVEARDLYRIIGSTDAARARSRMAVATVYYKLNPWCTFAFEQSLYTTIAVPSATTGLYPKVGGISSREWNDRREEFGPVFTF